MSFIQRNQDKDSAATLRQKSSLKSFYSQRVTACPATSDNIAKRMQEPNQRCGHTSCF